MVFSISHNLLKRAKNEYILKYLHKHSVQGNLIYRWVTPFVFPLDITWIYNSVDADVA